MYKYDYYCRWCGRTYKNKGNTDRDGFCSKAHKQAHWRAYKKYVTLQTCSKSDIQSRTVTRKKSKKH